MLADYRLGHKQKTKRGRKRRTLLIVAGLSILLIGSAILISNKLKPKTQLVQAHAVTNKVSYDQAAIKHYDEGDFGIDLPAAWQPVPRPPGPYNSFSWQRSDHSTNGEEITVYEDTIPANFAVNKVVIVDPGVDRVSTKGGVSDNCSTYTKNVSQVNNQVGAPARWQGVDFLCDQANQERDVIGTSSTDGVNTLILQSPSKGTKHKFFFTYTNHSTNPDYTVFYNVLSSFTMQ
jgi:hypothetical protein